MSARRDFAGPEPYAELAAMSNFSFLAGASHPHELVAQAKALGLSAIAIADRNTLAGAVRTHTAAKEAGLRTIPGARLELADAPDLVCLPTDRAAWGRLCRLLSLGQGRAEKGCCILTLADVAAHADGQVLIALPPADWDWRCAVGTGQPKRHDDLAARSGCAEGARFQHDPSRVATCSLEAALHRLREACPSARLYLAVAHTRRGEDRARIAALSAIAQRTRIPLVATGDVLYHASHRRPLADVLACVRHGISIAAAGLILGQNAERHLKSPQEMARLFRDNEAALARTGEIAAMCRFSLDELRYEYPDEPIPAGTTAQSHLETLARAGAQERFPGGVPEKVATTIDRELKLIDTLGFAPYFLTVHDIVAFARSKGILCQGRGSAANSVVCYALGITAVDPTEVDLLFERFISAERREPPDIDVDFEHERREEVIQYIYARYGRHRAGLAATVISYRARSAVRDVGRAMGLSEDTVSALAGMVWGTRSGGVLPEAHVREAGLDPSDPLLATVLALADELMGFPRHLSQHVGGFVLARTALIEIVPVGNAAMANRTFIEWDKDDLAALGLMKVDVLALGMLSCIRRAFDLIWQHRDLARRMHGPAAVWAAEGPGKEHGHPKAHAPDAGRHPKAQSKVPLTLASIPRDDPEVYDMLCRADSIGVFQVESRAQMNMLPRLKPRTFYDLVIEVAIVRPGPIQGDMVHPYLRRRDGLEPEIYPAPAPEHGDKDELRNILAKTKGVPLFQEQAMRIAMEAAKFTDGEVNELRKAMATFRRRGTIGLLEEKMVSQMVARGYDPQFAARCFNQIKGFGEYGFPESHAASFAHLVYVSAWLKCHHPAAFAAALLNSQPMGFYAPAQIVRDAREHGVETREADVNCSDWDATLEERVGKQGGLALRLGLRQIDGLQEAEAQKLVAARALLPFTSLADLQARAGLRLDTIERLSAADAMRSMGLDRRQALWEAKGLSRSGPLPLFAWSEAREVGPEPAVALPLMPLSEHVVSDYQTLRLSLKAHPMSFLRADLAAERILACADLARCRDGARVAVAGVILVRQRPGSAKGVVFMTIEDETGIANAVIWAKTLERFRRVVMAARLILIRGRIQRHGDIIHVVSERLEDRSDWLARLCEDAGAAMPVPIAHADEVLRPEPGSARGAHERHPGVPRTGNPSLTQTPPPSPARHPRYTRVLPRSRDFH